MADVIRKAIIELELRHKGGGAGGGGGAHAEVVRANKEIERATKEATRATTEFGFRSAASFREAGEGALRMSRGLALLSASGSDDLRKLIQTVAVAQGAFDVFAGGLKLVTNAAAFGPVGIAVAAVTTALGAGALAWQHWQNKAEAAAKKAAEEVEKAKSTLERFRQEQENLDRSRADERGILGQVSGARAGAATTDEERARRLRAEDATLAAAFAASEKRERQLERPIRQGTTPGELAFTNPAAAQQLLGLNQEQMQISERRTNIARDLMNEEIRQLQEAERRRVEAAQQQERLHPGSVAPQPIAAQSQLEQQEQEARRRHQSSLDAMVDAMEAAATEFIGLKKALEGANANR